MADKNHNSEQDNAYIASLLSKLRESLGQTDPMPDSVSESTSESGVASAPPEEEPGIVRYASVTPENEEAVESVTGSASVSDLPKTDTDEYTHDGSEPEEDASEHLLSDESSLEAEERSDTLHEPLTDASVDTVGESEGALLGDAAVEAITDNEVSGRDAEASGGGGIASEPVMSDSPQSSVATTAYARTVQPGDPRFSGRNTTGRFLDFLTDNQGASSTGDVSGTPTDRIVCEPPVSDCPDETCDDDVAPVTPDSPAELADVTIASPAFVNTQATLSSDEELHSSEVFGADPVDISYSESGMPVPDRVAASVAPGEWESVWSTLPPIPQEDEPTETSGVSVPLTTSTAEEVQPEDPEASLQKNRLFDRPERPTLADCSFDADTRKNVLVDKILAASQDLEPGKEKGKQEQLWRQELLRKRLAYRIRVIAVGVLLLLSVAVELIPPFPRALLSRLLLTRVPGALHLIDLQILLLAALIGAPQIVRGFAAMRFRRIIPESLLLFAVTVSVIAGVYLSVADFSGKYFCALPAVLMIFISLLGDMFRLRALSHAFESYSAKGHHFCAVVSDVREHPLLKKEFADAKNPRLFETASASGIEHFVEASRRRVESRRAGWISLSVSCFSALLSVVLSIATRSSAVETVWAFTLALVSVVPLTLFGAHRYLFAMLTSRVSEERVGIADEMTVFDYAHTGVMTFEDTEAFPAGSVQLSGIKLCGDFRLDKALYLMASVFDVVGGPLNGVFRVSTSDINISDNVDIRALFEEGIDARVNHEDVLIGTKAFLEARGVSVFRDVEDERTDQGRSRVLYLAYMGTLSAKFHLNYRMSDVFESNVEYYAKHGVASAIMTADPLLNRAFLDRISYISEYDVRIVKKTCEALVEEDKPCEATLITYGPRKTLRRMPFFFSAYAKYQAAVIAIMMVMTALAAVYVPVLLCVTEGTVPWLSFVTQLLSALPCVIFGFLILRLNPNK